MVEDDTFTYHVKQQPRDQINKAQINASAHSLITKERMQKLDLLIHLLSNLTQALVICGPEGIGKTTLLNVLQQRKTEAWRYCLIQANTGLSFEAILQQLSKVLVSQSGQSLSMALTQYQGQHKQVILIIDNAGELVPGLITAIIQYAAANPILRVIFALTHDELQVKHGSDKSVGDCHIVEIPTLSEKQCGDFLRHQSTNAAMNLSFQAISENMIAHIYRETHGVPGRIIAKISGASAAKQGGKLRWVLPLTVVIAGAIAVGVQWLASSNHKEAISRVAVEQGSGDIEMTVSKSNPSIMLTLPSDRSVIQAQEPVLSVNEDDEESSVEVGVSSDEQQPVVQVEKTEEASASDVPPSDQTAEDRGNAERLPRAVATMRLPVHPKPPLLSREKPQQVDLSKTVASVEPFTSNNLETIQIPPKPIEVAGVLDQQTTEIPTPLQLEPEESLVPSANNFTLQLMVLSKQSSVNNMLKKYPAMTSGFRTIKMLANGKEKFIIVFGSYADAASAKKAKRSLPFEFRNALVRKVSSIKH
ncbi:MAG: AAA family ATPase [Methylobacter sp.]|nr:AAA family ATPase [Methylobacter sp.]